jgi:hypothetical protein
MAWKLKLDWFVRTIGIWLTRFFVIPSVDKLGPRKQRSSPVQLS